MPTPGGLSDKYGNRYEERWTVRCLFSVLRGDAEAIRLEPLGPEGEGVEFWLRFADRVEYHQVKRQRTGEGHWPLGALKSAGVLEAFFGVLQDPDAHCTFVSGHAADALDELSDRARAATSWDEFDAEFLSSKTWRTEFEQLHRAWKTPDATLAFSALRRIHVVTVSETELASRNDLEAQVELAGDLEKAVAVLSQLISDRAGSYLTAADLWPAMEPLGYTPNPWRSAKVLTACVVEANARFASSRERTLIGGDLISRPEADELRALVADEPVVVLDGDAGMGKSDVLLELIRSFERDGVPFIALRLDRATPTLRPDDLGSEMGLPGSPPAVLSAHAQDQLGVLVIDQLDVVSTTSGRSPQFFDCVAEMLALARSMPTLRVVLSCRTFDIDNDARLRQLVPRSDPKPIVTVGPLPGGQVSSIVGALGYDADSLTGPQKAILSVPLHLGLLSEVAQHAGVSGQRLDFTAASDLYEAFWKQKKQDVEERLGRAPAWTHVLDGLVDYMSDHQVLQAPRELVDDYEADAEAMVSSRVLVMDRGRLAFFHETFFDYVFARRFSARQRTVQDLLSVDQLLFRRGQVRQILAYNRERGGRYIEDLGYLLGSESVRFHLRDLVVSWLSQVTPSTEEWALLLPHLNDVTSPLHSRAWRTIATADWFAKADREGYLERCLNADAPYADLALQTLGLVGDEFLDRAAELLRPYAEGSTQGRQRVWAVLSRTDLGASRKMFRLFIDLLDSGALDDLGVTRQDFWYIAHDLPKSAPALANELLGHYLENRLGAASAAGLEHPFDRRGDIIPGNLHLLEFVGEAAAGDPQSFLEHVWPRMRRIIESALQDSRDGGLRRDDVWDRRHFSDVYGGLDDHLLLGAERAFRALAEREPEKFSDLSGSLDGTESETVVHLLFEGYASNAAVFANRAIALLIADPRRLRVSFSDGDEWGTRRLLEAVTPTASDEVLRALEPVLLSCYTRWERSAAGHTEFGLTQFALLGGVDASRRTPAMSQRFAEWQRKFLRSDAWPPFGIQGGFVESPIASDAARKMSDDQWVRALTRYDDDEFAHRKELLKGGAHQLSSVLQSNTAEAPERFATFALGLPDHVNPAYFDAVLIGVAESEDEIGLELTERLLLRCHALPSRPCGRWIARPLRAHVKTPFSPPVVELLTWYATEDPDPAADRAEEPGDRGPGERLLQHGLNSVRGDIAYEVTRFIWEAPSQAGELLPAVRRLVNDPVVAVRAMAAEILIALLRDDSPTALGLFGELVGDAPDELLASQHVYDFLRYRIDVDFDHLRPTLERMVRSSVEETQQRGSALVSIAALSLDEARDLAEECVRGTEAQRLGAARVYAANLTTARYRGRCSDALVAFFDDPAKTVRDAAADVVRRFSGTQLAEFSELVTALNGSAAAGDSWDDLLFALVESTSPVPAIALSTCKELLESFASGDGAVRVSAAHNADLVSQVLVRVYTDGDMATKRSALDLIDRSLQLNIYGAHKALADHDRPWLSGA